MKLILLRFIKKYKAIALFFCLAVFSATGFAQKEKLSFGLLVGYEFSSTYFNKNETISIDESLKTNYKIGFLFGKIKDTSLVSFKYGIYYQYRKFNVSTSVEEQDPDYTDYISVISPEYFIFGIPLFFDWKLYSKNKFIIRANTGFNFEISVGPQEYSKYSHRENIKSRRLIGTRDWMTGIPLHLGIGAEYKLNKNFRIGLYPSVNIYLKKFNGAAETDYPITFGLNLFLIKVAK